MLRILASALFLFLAHAAFDSTARAEGLADALGGFAKDSYTQTVDALSAVAATGDERAVDVVRALKNGRLYFTKADGKVYIKDNSGALFDAATGEPFTGDGPFGLKKVRVNNLVRGAIEATLGSLNLLGAGPDAARGRRRGGVQVARRDRASRASRRRSPRRPTRRSSACSKRRAPRSSSPIRKRRRRTASPPWRRSRRAATTTPRRS